MHSHSIKVLLDLPKLNVCHIQKEHDQILIEMEPIDSTQSCPICASGQTIRRGTAYQRKVRHQQFTVLYVNGWQEEICNYHQLRFTNAAVEGRNNKIKALQRRHYFTRNPACYKQHILLECNEEWIQYGS